ncbi:hypothetical protein BDF20DRAFT_914016 [Mycotypha africana]|uniref:uncharacterized protein n=1 Tax=Mycotypha africana TaxID=64632 RepID=UPI002301E687|nr:uncharacterized protein BDF20DRAFT_914016 [Mycotypha africana]KAI8975027.1 hypothetical protein BDF20DRAFT_914016 [Mycotypha africana]
MISSRAFQYCIAIAVGVGTGVYVFKPLLREYEQDTNGTWLTPGDEQRLRDMQEKRQHNNKL